MTLTTVTMERAHHAAMDGDTGPPERPLRRWPTVCLVNVRYHPHLVGP
jgi:hypothetical protein